jgi:flagellar basal-body rod protein FlgC
MTDELKAAIISSSSGLRAQSTRIRVVSENLANASATALVPGGDPYARKTISFAQELDRASGLNLVRINAIGRDPTPYPAQHMPGHPAADSNGYVKLSNVNPLIELSDMREANRSYEANLQMVRQAREMIGDLIDLLKGK